MDVLIKALQNKDIFNHVVTDFKVIQTHLSWVILTGQYAYKIKKPLNLGFQDFTTLEKRKHYCEMEVQLNKRLADDIYLEVLPISGAIEQPNFNQDGPAIEYAIKMKEFSQANMLDQLAKEQTLSASMIQQIAEQLAEFHQKAEVADAKMPYGTYQDVMDPIIDNFNALKQMPFTKDFTETLNRLENWAKDKGNELKNIITQRHKAGRTKACHGDVHLGNMVLIDNKPVIFDCIEFNDNFRFTDVMNDVGFFYMDLYHKNFEQYAQIFINHYLEQSGDYEGALLNHFYASYRAMVRAKVTGFMMTQTDEHSPEYQQRFQELKGFIKLADFLTQKQSPSVTITFGLSGSGKSVHTQERMQEHNTIRLRSDIIRKQLFDIPLYQKTPASKLQTVYAQTATEKVYQTMVNLCEKYLEAGFQVLIDAACLQKWQRQLFQQCAEQHAAPFKILSFDVDINTLKSRLKKRSGHPQEISDATEEVLEMQSQSKEDLTKEEMQYVENVDLALEAC